MVETAVPQLVGVLGLFLVLTWLFTGLRVYVRCLISKGWGVDDFLLLAALVSFTGYVSCALLGIRYGIGRHAADIPNKDASQGVMIWWVFELLYTITTVLLRCSIAVFILRIFPKRIHRIIIYATTAVVLTFSTFYFFLVIFQCRPVSYYWTQYGPDREGTCIDPTIFPVASYTHSAVSASADWVLGLLPIWLIWDLQMNIRKKLSVGVLLSFGMIAGVAAILRVPFIRILAISDDTSFATVNVAICSTVEPGLGIIATAACVLRPLMKRFYGLSSYSTNRIGDTNTHPSAWHNERASTARSKAIPGYTQRQDFGKEGIELESIITSVRACHKGERGREWTLTSLNPRQKAGNESEEELTTEGKGIVVHKTVEIRRHNNFGGQRKADSISSMETEH